MKSLKSKLLAATILVGASSPAYAQFAFPTVQLDGVGASTPGDINQKVQNAIGVDVQLATNSGSLTTITPADYTPTTPSATNPELDVSLGDNVYNAGTTTYTGTYISTGSGFGKQQWRNFTNNFDGTASNTVPAAAPFGIKNNYQYAFSEAPLLTSDITDYNADDVELGTAGTLNGVDIDVSALAAAGPAIQIPLYVVPVAFAYNSQYGVSATGPMNFNNKFPVLVNGLLAGGIRMTKADYCNIWNGNITNWNDAALKTRNGNQALYDPNTDNATRWAAEGAPIRLIGRADKSGATDVFTRAMAAQCASTPGNKYLNAAESLPFDPTGTIDLRGIRSNTDYKPGTFSAIKYAGSVQSLSGFAFDRNGVSCDLSSVPTNASGGVCTVVATFGTLVTPGTGILDTAGKFANADGSGNVEKAIKANTGTALVTLTSGVKIDGKLGYIGADFTAPTPGRTLFSAALQIGTGTTYAIPNAANASAAFGTVFPPQSIASSGAYNVTDARTIYVDLSSTNPADPSYQGTKTPDRGVPQDWVNSLYPTSGATLANPTKGYPVTGTANLLTYTCFSSQAKVHGIANFVQYLTGKVTKKNAIGGTPASINLSANTFPGTAAATLGILAKANIATVPAGWRTAYLETFFKKSTQKSPGQTTTLGARNLWIQSAQPTTATGTGATSLTTVDAPANKNPNCVGVTGA